MGNGQIQSLRVEDFSGGMTDFYIGNADSSKFQLADNKVINDNQDLVTRQGCTIDDEANDQILSGEDNVNDILDCDDVIYKHSGRSLFYTLSGTMSEVTGPTGNKVFPTGDDTLKGSFTVWNKHLICASSNYAPIMRVYKDQAGAIKVNNLGLPSTEAYSCIALANDLKAKYNAHRINVSQHGVADTVNVVTSANATDFDSLVTLTAELLTKYAAHRADAALVTPTYHVAQSTANALASTTSPTSLFEIQERLNDLKTKFNAHDADGTAHTGTSLNQVTLDSVFKVAAGGAGARNYLYAIMYSHTYKVGEVQYKEIGPVTIVELSNSLEPSSSNNPLTNLPVLVNGTVNNYATSDVKIEIARTTDGGDIFYYLGEVTNGTTTYTDATSDANLQDSFPIYISGGALDNEEPPKGKYVKIVNDSLVVGNVKEGTVIRPFRARVSKIGIPYSHPSTFTIDFIDDINGLGSINVYPIVMLENRCYRLEGSLDSLGRGGYQKREISTKVGTISHRSITDTRDGLVFASEDGFYFTEGFRVTKISKEISTTYKNLADKEDICGAYDKDNNYVLFGVKRNSSSLANDTVFCGHGDYVRQDGEVPFTTWSGGLNPSNFTATALAFINGFVYRGDRRGYVFKHSEDVFTDPRIDTAVSAEDWFTETIIYDYRSVAYDFGSGDAKKWVSKLVVNADNRTSLSLDIYSNNDNSGVFKELKPIVDRGNIEWGDPTLVWSDTSLRWNYYPTISAWRRFPNEGLRCQYKQIRLTNRYTQLDDSTVVGNVSINSSLDQVTLLNHPSFDFIPDPVGYYISFASDNYAQEFLITDISGGTLTVENGAGLLVDSAGTAWRMNGYRKREVLNIINYVIQFNFLTTTQAPYKAQSGEG